MRTPSIQSIIASNPDAIFHVAWTNPPDFYNRRPSRVERVAKLHFHPEHGDLRATIVGADYPRAESPDSKPQKPMRIDARNVIKLYGENH